MAGQETAYGKQWTSKIKANECGMQKTSTGRPMMVVEVEVLDGEHKGSVVQFRGLLNPDDPKQTARTMDAMEALGCANFRNDPFSGTATVGLGRKIARGVLAMDTDQNGVERLVCKFVNPDTIIRSDAVASDGDRKQWRVQFGSVVKKFAEAKALAKAEGGTGTQEGEDPNF